MKIKTSELTGIVLDWAVMKCEGSDSSKWIDDDIYGNHIERPYSPSTDWSQAGPIIERECIDLTCRTEALNNNAGAEWDATIFDDGSVCATGPTPLQAAMRCYVASKLGDEVEIPEELV